MSTQFYRNISAAFKLRPQFIIIGAQKAGTTSLYEYLVRHPGVASAKTKEVHFFDQHFFRGLGWYWNQFPGVWSRLTSPYRIKHGVITGEASPYYMPHPNAPRRIKQFVPHAKLIVLLRNPIDRAYSHYKLRARRGREHIGTFEEAIDAEAERLNGEWEKMIADEKYYSINHQRFSYLERGHYAEQLERWFALFSREQFLILKSEELFEDPPAVYGQVTEFLGLPLHQLQDFQKFNSATYTEMNPATRERLQKYFAPHNARLQELLGRDFGWD
jgi:hypothetical protein